MASEIQSFAQLNASKLGVNVSVARSAVIDMNGTNMMMNTQLVGLSAESLFLGDIVNAPAVVCVSHTGTNAVASVDFALDSGMTQKFATLKAGEPMLFRPATSVMWVKANVLPVTIHIGAVEQ